VQASVSLLEAHAYTLCASRPTAIFRLPFSISGCSTRNPV